MRNARAARTCFGITSVIVLAAVVLQLVLTLTKDPSVGRFETTPARLVNFFSFFTIQSNITVAVTTGLLAVRLDRDSTVFRVFRLDGIVCIIVTGVVFHVLLADQVLHGWDAVTDFVLHTLSPILCPLGWLVFGPRRRIDPRLVGLAVIPPLGWLVYAFLYGGIAKDRLGVHYYAYEFMDVTQHGYAASFARCAVVAAFFLALGFGALAIDRWLAARPDA